MTDQTQSPTRTLPFCLAKSAWRSWQTAGLDWRKSNPDATPDAMLTASTAFASQATGENERRARKRAFIEGATS